MLGKIFTWFGCTNRISDWVLSLEMVMAESSCAVVINDIPEEGIEHQDCPDGSTIVSGARVVSLDNMLQVILIEIAGVVETVSEQ